MIERPAVFMMISLVTTAALSARESTHIISSRNLPYARTAAFA